MYFLWYIIIGILAGFVAVRSAGNRNDRSVGQSDNFNCRSCRFVVDCFIV